MTNPFKWGVISTGGIARTFASDLQYLDNQVVHAVGSRKMESALNFSNEYGGKPYASYEELANDPNIDAVYIATPHQLHFENTMMALKAGKPVLCEKPFAITATEAHQMISLAREMNLMLMEAMWTRFLPHIAIVREILTSGILGEIRTVTADHGQWFADDPEFRLFNPNLAGGALLDLAIYPISFAHLVLGVPEKITSTSLPAFTGVDGQTSAIFDYKNGAQAIINSSLFAATPCRALVAGTLGWLEIDRTFYAPTSMRTIIRGGERTEYAKDYVGVGHREQAVEFARCVRAGLIESPLLTLNETYEIMQSVTEIKNQIGLKYPFEI